MKRFVILILAALLLCGCSLFEQTEYRTEKNAEELASDGASAFMAQDYKDALKAYTDLKDWYPFSRYAILAELKIADSHYHLEEYEEAILAYEEFERMHPKNDAIPYVIYQIGMSWFNQLDTIDRDHTPAQKALAQFNRLADQFPNSEYTTNAAAHYEKCMKHLSGHELYVANFYMKTKKYKAALARYEYLIERFPESIEAKVAAQKLPEARRLAREK